MFEGFLRDTNYMNMKVQSIEELKKLMKYLILDLRFIQIQLQVLLRSKDYLSIKKAKLPFTQLMGN